MLANTAVFTCSICGEASSNICAYCTKDACANHQCARCKRCSDCCECEVPLSAEEAALGAGAAPEPALAPEPAFGGERIAEIYAGEQMESRPGEPILTPEEASVFVFEKREAIEIQEPDVPSDPEEPGE